MSTAILTLSENGDLQRIHDKWFTRDGCIYETDEIDSERFNLSSFWGLFLICGISCVLALLIYFISMFRQYNQLSSSSEQDPSSQQMYRSGRSLRKFFSFVDNREEDAKNKSQRGEMQKSNNNGTTDVES